MSDVSIFICPVCKAVIEGDRPCPNGPHEVAEADEYLPLRMTHGWSDRFIDGCIEAGAEKVGNLHHATCLRVKAYRAALREWSAQHPPPYDDDRYAPALSGSEATSPEGGEG